MLRGTYFTRLRGRWGGGRDLGVRKEGSGVGFGVKGGGRGAPPKKNTGGALPARFAGAKKNGEGR